MEKRHTYKDNNGVYWVIENLVQDGVMFGQRTDTGPHIQKLGHLEDLEEELEFKQNTIDDFHESTKAMIDELFDLASIKLADFLPDGRLLTKTAVLEAFGSVVQYIKTFAYGGKFND